jgi:hypothetical protein
MLAGDVLTMPNEKIAILELRKPIMNGFNNSSEANPCVGIAHRKLVYNDTIIIKIIYTDKDGNRIFPYDYKMSCREALAYPIMLLPDKVTPVHVIPISRLTQILNECPEPPITKGSFREIVKKSQKVAKRMSSMSKEELDRLSAATYAIRKQEEKERNDAK